MALYLDFNPNRELITMNPEAYFDGYYETA